MAGIKIARGTDPFKKYWWVILVAFAAVGGWICLPALSSSPGGSSGQSAEAGLKTADQSLDSADNPSGAPGSALDMPGAPKKAAADGLTSSLYQAPGGAVAVSTVNLGAAPTFADALRDITRASAARASVAASAGHGGWGEAPQRGFTAPKANFGALSGFGGGSASAASISAGSSGGGAVGSFGSRGPNTGVSFAQGLSGEDKGEPGVKAVMHSLENARAASIAAAGAGSADVARSQGGSAFDGSRGGGSAISGGGGGVGNTGGVYGSIDSAPINLKANDPNLNKTKITPPPMPTPQPAVQNPLQAMIMQLIMGIAMAGIMAMV